MNKLLEIEDEDELAIVEMSPEFSFISACLKVAFNSVGTTREKVTNEVADLLECDITDLDFMFNDRSTNMSDNEVFDFPDSERRRAALASLAQTTSVLQA